MFVSESFILAYACEFLSFGDIHELVKYLDTKCITLVAFRCNTNRLNNSKFVQTQNIN